MPEFILKTLDLVINNPVLSLVTLIIISTAIPFVSSFIPDAWEHRKCIVGKHPYEHSGYRDGMHTENEADLNKPLFVLGTRRTLYKCPDCKKKKPHDD